MIMEVRVRESVAVLGLPGVFGAMVWRDGDRDDDGRNRYGWCLFGEDGRVLALAGHGDVLRSRCGADVDPRGALSSLFSFLGADAQRYARVMGPITDPYTDPYLFGDAVAEWAYGVAEELAAAQRELDAEVSR